MSGKKLEELARVAFIGLQCVRCQPPRVLQRFQPVFSRIDQIRSGRNKKLLGLWLNAHGIAPRLIRRDNAT